MGKGMRHHNRGGSQADRHQPPKYVSYVEIIGAVIASYWPKQPAYLFAFRNHILLPKFVKAVSCRNNENCNTEIHGYGGVKLVKIAREPT